MARDTERLRQFCRYGAVEPPQSEGPHGSVKLKLTPRAAAKALAHIGSLLSASSGNLHQDA